MATGIKDEMPEEEFRLKLETDGLQDLQEKIANVDEFVTNEDDQFDADNALTMNEYQDDVATKESDIIGNLMIDNNVHFEHAPEGTYITMDEGSQGEQFLTIPRGNSQITVCDNGIIYSDENIGDAVHTQLLAGEQLSDIDGQQNYSEPENQGELAQETTEMSANDLTEIGNESSSNIMSIQGLEGSYITVPHGENIQIGDAFFSSSDLNNLIASQDISRGIKRPKFSQASPVKNKIFIQSKPSVSTASSQPVKFKLGPVMGARSMSLRQAQRLGLIGSNVPTIKQVVQGQESTPARMIVKKVIASPGQLQPVMKSATKILPAPSPKVLVRSPATSRTNTTIANLTQVRTTVPISQLRAFNTVNSNNAQLQPVTISKTITGIPVSKSDSRAIQKVVIRPSKTSMVTPVSGLVNTFQPIQFVTNQQQVQYVRLVCPDTVVLSPTAKSSTRTIPIAPSPMLPKPQTSNIRKIVVPKAADSEISTQLDEVVAQDEVNEGDEMSNPLITVYADSDNADSELADEDGLIAKEAYDEEGTRVSSPIRVLEANGIRPKKPCNCTKSQCLKLYCECFANGEFCFQCNCNNCFNNIDHESERQLSIQSCLERNPDAFRPRFQVGGESEEEERRQNRGCNCKKTFCLKNYCECFEAKIPCSKLCKCSDCKNPAADNTEDWPENPDQENTTKIPSSLKECLAQCLVAQIEAVERKTQDRATAERRMIEEFGRCLVQLIGNGKKKEAPLIVQQQHAPS